MINLINALQSLQTSNPLGLPVSSRVQDAVPVRGTNIRVGIHHNVTERDLITYAQKLAQHPAMRFLQNARYNVLDANFIHPFERNGIIPPLDKIHLVIYNYDANRGFEVIASYPDPRKVEVRELQEQPFTSEEEFRQAVEILMADPKHGEPLRKGQAFCSPGMPPVLDGTASPDTFVRYDGVPIGGKPPKNRTLAIVMHFPGGVGGTARVGKYFVDMVAQRVTGYGSGGEGDFFPAACGGLPSGGGSSTTTGNNLVTIQWPQANPVWSFQVRRPSATTDDQPAGAGVEIRSVYYRGKLLLKRGGVPVLNVFYDGNACGPYRDWLYSETSFDCTGTDLGNGIRWDTTGTGAKTICDDLTDAGNWRGVAVYELNGELVLVSECSAGWYRYITGWRFTQDGILKPFFQYGYTENGCVCYGRLHNAYWRLDFDLNGTANQVVEESESPMREPNPRWTMFRREAKRYRRRARNTRWRVRNTVSGEIAEIIPNAYDGNFESMSGLGRGDLWALRYKGTGAVDQELNGSSGADANLDQYVNYEDIVNQNVVVWYGVHLRKRGSDLWECPVLGPDIVLKNW